MKKVLVSLFLIAGFSFANAAGSGHSASRQAATHVNTPAKSTNKIKMELPIAPVGSFDGGLF
ncbi:MAG: hypothetical protein EKK57_06205 [Proteobacteria bacterium]|nr:MAG: hypothetical protein EKK57_06205 [Pseudomonadota bacterium]